MRPVDPGLTRESWGALASRNRRETPAMFGGEDVRCVEGCGDTLPVAVDRRGPAAC
jgi:hypothetical protein